jgi:pyrophosphate--fructose-6-phosphate 1-phosphotransferase
MMNIEQRKGKAVPVIQKALVELDGAPFKAFSKQRENWSIDDCYLFPGAIQYFGPADLCDATPHTLALEQQ